MSPTAGDICWVKLSIKRPAYELLHAMPGNPDDCNAVIQQELRQIEQAIANIGRGRPCVILPRTERHIARAHTPRQPISVCPLATFRKKPYSHLPLVIQSTIAPVNGLSKFTQHRPVYNTAWHLAYQRSETDWIICVPVETEATMVGGQWRQGQDVVRIDSQNMATLMANIQALPSELMKTVKEKAEQNRNDKFKLKLLYQFMTWTSNVSDRVSVKGSFTSGASRSSPMTSASTLSRVTSQASYKSKYSFHSPERPSPLRQDHSKRTAGDEPLTPTNGSFGQRVAEVLDKVGGAAARRVKENAIPSDRKQR